MRPALARHPWPVVCAGFFIVAALVHGQQPATAEKGRSPEAAAVVTATNSMQALDSTRPVSKGDRLSYRVVEERQPPVVLTIADSGEIEVPLIGRVKASGRTCKELAQTVKPMLEREYFYTATVIIGLESESGRARGRVYVTGQVHQQGPVDIPPDERFTLSKALLKAGGLADFANIRKIKLIRKDAKGSPQITIVDLEPVIKSGKLDKDPEVLPDDTVIVPAKFVNF